MTNTVWNNAVSANWTTVADWSGGVPTGSTDAVFNTNGAYLVTLSSATAAHSLTMDAVGATLFETGNGSLNMAGGLTVDVGTVILDGANNFTKQTRLISGTLNLGNSAALGTSDVTIYGGTLAGSAPITISNSITANGSFTLAAGHGDTVTLASQMVLNMSGGTIDFGRSGADGIFVWSALTLGIVNGAAGFKVSVNDGTLYDGNGRLNEVLSAATGVNIASGAKIDVHGNAETISNLQGGGTVTSTVSGGALTMIEGNFSGGITGDMALTIKDTVALSGASTYTGGTTIERGARLSLTQGGTILGNVVDNGVLSFDSVTANPVDLPGGISGTGAVQIGNSTILMNGTNTYSGGTAVNFGVLEIGNASALGTGPITVANATLTGMATEAVSDQLVVQGPVTFLAAPGTTLTLNMGAGWTINSSTQIVFGATGSGGVVVWDSPAGSTNSGHGIVEVAGGTLRAGDSNFQTLLNYSTSSGHTDIEGGAILDIAGFTSKIYNVQGSGTIENTGTAATVTLSGGTFTGEILGPIALDVGGVVTLGGGAAHFGMIDVLSGGTLQLDAGSSSDILLSSDSHIVIEKPRHFTGTIGDLQQGVTIQFDGIGGNNTTIGYSGDTSGGTLTLSRGAATFSVTLVGNYTADEFSYAAINTQSISIKFTPSASAAVTAATDVHADAFDFSTAAAPHVSADASVAHMHGGYAASEIAFAHDVTEAMHAHGLVFDHVAHGLFAHGYGFAEALL